MPPILVMLIFTGAIIALLLSRAAAHKEPLLRLRSLTYDVAYAVVANAAVAVGAIVVVDAAYFVISIVAASLWLGTGIILLAIYARRSGAHKTFEQMLNE